MDYRRPDSVDYIAPLSFTVR